MNFFAGASRNSNLMSMSEPNKALSRNLSRYARDFLCDPLAFRGQQLRGGGPVAEFEQALAERCGYAYCVATCNATTALIGLVLALKLTKRTVWFPKGHWEGSVSAFRIAGVRIRRYGLPVGGRRLPQPASGGVGALVVGSDTLEQEMQSYSGCGWVIEDSNRLPGVNFPLDGCSKADIQVLSFGPGKPMPLGEGGAVLLRKRKTYEAFVRVTQHPERVKAEFGGDTHVSRHCVNGRIHPMSALLGVELLQRLADCR